MFELNGNGRGSPEEYRPNSGNGYGEGALRWLSFERRGPVLIVSGFGAGPLGFSTGDGRAPTENWPTSE